MKHLYLARLVSIILIITSMKLIAQDQDQKSTIPTVQEALDRMAKGERFNMKKVFQHNDPDFTLSGKEDNPYLRLEFDFNRLRDPSTGQIPDKIREKELGYVLSKKSNLQRSLDKSGLQRAVGDITSPWVNRGPFNVGGRTRGIAIDLNDEDIIIAGGVSGGLWKTLDQGLSWDRVSELDDNPSITAVIQDPTTTNIWYYATGEWTGTSANARNGAAFFAGNGIWKSVDNGNTWNELSSTTTDRPQSYNNVFQYNMNMVISPTTGHLYVANSGGIYESQDDGSSFNQVLDATPFTETDVVVDSDGILYAAFDSGAGTNTGVFRSEDGSTWTSITPSGFPSSYNRITLGIAPSNEDVVWVFVESTGNANGLDHDLWKFTYDAADSDGDGGTWEDRSANLPAIGGNVGDLNTQGGYDMYVKAHPTNEDIVFLGATNIYRSTDGFTSTANTDWIGGYSPRNDVSLYSDHHPDNHNLLFFDSNSSMALSSHDGGISITSDILANSGGTEAVDWTLLSNGYLTTQVYALSIGPGDQIMAGFQDNSTWFSSSTSSNATWVDQFSGDGSYNQINNDGTIRYVSAQRGVIARQTYSDANSSTPLTSSRISPTGASDELFIAPIEMDPNNDEILYFAAGSSVWRNTKASTATSDTWDELSNAQASSGSVSSIGISTNPPNTIYFGTTTGGVYRVENAIAGSPSGTDLSTGKGLPSGNVANVEVDPADGDHVFITFSNYSIPSIFETADGGVTWTDISGNLEENSDGTGSGPSVRWLDMVGDNDVFFVGTSTGLYTTQTIDGSSTIWTQVEPNSIGNAVVEQIRSREDGLVVVGTHGNGLFSAVYEVSDDSPVITVNQGVPDQEVAENSADVVVDISNAFATTGDPFSVEIFDNSNTSLVSTSLEDDELTLSFTPNAVGEANITLRAFEDSNEAFTSFLVTVGGDLFEGTYTMIQQTNSVFGTVFAPDGVNIVELVVVDENTRSFSEIYLEAEEIGNGPRSLQFTLNDEDEVVFVDNQSSGLTCSLGLSFGAADTPGTYDPLDDSDFTMTLKENTLSDCGTGPVDVTFQLFVNEAPTAVAIDNTRINEGLPAGTLIGTVSAVDVNPNDIFNFSLGGTDASSFNLNGTDLESAIEFDFATKSSYDIDLTVTDASGAEFVQNLQIVVNAAPEVVDVTFALNEGSELGTLVGVVSASDPNGDDITFSIVAGNDLGAFQLDSSTGEISVADAGPLDFDTNPTFALIVQVSDGALTDNATITINLNEEGVDNQAPVIADATFTIDENASIGTAVGMVTASDSDGDVLSFSITAGNDLGAFQIDSSSGEISVANSGPLDFDTNPTFTLAVEVSDGALTDDATITINLNEEGVDNQAPVIADATFTIDENAPVGTEVGMVTASDPDGDVLSYSITAGNDLAAFQIDAATGAITVLDSGPLDFDTNPTFTLTVEVSDGVLTDNATITINLNEEGADNQAPVIADATFTIDENASIGTAVGMVTASDPDGDVLSYSITAGNDLAAFRIDAATGAITVLDSGPLDFDTNPTFTLTVEVSDGALTDDATITINLNEEGVDNQAPVIADATFTIDENASIGTTVGMVTATDPDGDVLSYSITAGNDLAAFQIDAATGAITVLDSGPLDFETTSSSVLSIEVSDGELSDNAEITINLNNLNELPSAEDAIFTIDENSGVGTEVGTVTASDPDGDVLSFTISAGNDLGAFQLNATTGAITVADREPLDFDTNPSFVLIIEVNDGELTDNATITINLNEIENRAPLISDATFAIDENSGVGTEVGTVTASDPDGDVLTYSIVTGNDLGAFQLNANTGTISVLDSAPLDFEVNPAFNLAIQVSDGELTDLAIITINLNEIENRAPVISDATFAIDENSAVGTEVGTVIASDSDGDVLIYSIVTGNDLGAFQIEENTGTITVLDSAPLDFEVNPAFTIAIQVSDDELTDLGIITINLNDLEDVNQAPSVSDATMEIDENLPEGTIVGNVVATDPEGDVLTYAIVSGNDLNAFQIDDNSGELTVANSDPLDFESNPSFDLAVEVSDGELSDVGLITINLNDLEEPLRVDDGMEEVSLFPNPTTGVISITQGDNEVTSVFVTDINGREVAFQMQPSSGQLILDLSENPAGLYVIHLFVDEVEQMFKILKK